MPARWRLVTAHAPGASAAIGVFHLHSDIDAALTALGLAPLRPGEVSLRTFSDIDRGIAARPDADSLLLMPHAGPAILRRLESWLESRGVSRDLPAGADDPRDFYPEASSIIEARMLHALARAESPMAIDLLLDQPRRWAAASPGAESDPGVLARSSILNRLIDPPTIVALGPPNIGKSTLLNALARRAVSIVADEPGTTRDHVGLRLDLAGLVVNYIDTPGIDPASTSEIDRDAQSLALTVGESADLIVLCADRASPFLHSVPRSCPSLRLGLRADLGAVPDADISICARDAADTERLVRSLRDLLIPPGILDDPGPWRFW